MELCDTPGPNALLRGGEVRAVPCARLYGFPIPKFTEKQALDDSRIDFTTTNVPSGFIFLRMDEYLQAQSKT